MDLTNLLMYNIDVKLKLMINDRYGSLIISTAWHGYKSKHIVSFTL